MSKLTLDNEPPFAARFRTVAKLGRMVGRHTEPIACANTELTARKMATPTGRPWSALTVTGSVQR
jgi:hypothetical protein